MDNYVHLISQLRHAEAGSYAKTAFKKGSGSQFADSKKQSEFRKALQLLAVVEQAYFDGKLLLSSSKGSEKTKALLDIDARYNVINKSLQLVTIGMMDDKNRGKDPGAHAIALQKYCSLRCEFVSLYRELDEKGFNFIDTIPKIRSLLTLATDLKPQDETKEAQKELHQLLQVELEYLLSVHQCLWEANRLQAPAAVVHLATAKKKLDQLQDRVPPETLKKRSHLRLMQFLVSLYSSAYGKVTLVFLHMLQRPVDEQRDAPADYTRIKRTIDDASLLLLWPACGKVRRNGLGRLAPNESEMLSNVLKSIDSMQEEAFARTGLRPSFNVFYNATASGFSHSLNLSSTRKVLPKYLPCGQKEQTNETLSGLRGFPCILSYPEQKFPQKVMPLLTSMPFYDSGKVTVVPSVVTEVLDEQLTERARQSRLVNAEARKRLWTSKLEAAKSGVTQDTGSKDLLEGEVDPKGWWEGVAECDELESNASFAKVPTPVPSPSKPLEDVPKAPTGYTVLTSRIGLLFYVVVCFEGLPQDTAWVAEWLKKFATSMIGAKTSCLTSLTKELK